MYNIYNLPDLLLVLKKGKTDCMFYLFYFFMFFGKNYKIKPTILF